MIQFIDVSKIYDIGDQELRALDHANIHIRPGEFVSIIGPSGSGKSTLMNIMGCLDTADEGQYILDGVPIEEYTEKQLTKVRNQKIGFVFQSFNLISNLTAEENVELPLIYQGVKAKERKIRVEEALKKVQIYDRKNHHPNQLSGGQQQRVAIARAMASKPSLILADEPTGNLDSQTGDQIMEIFHELHQQGNTIVLITHNEEIALQADRSIRIKDGHVERVDDEAEGVKRIPGKKKAISQPEESGQKATYQPKESSQSDAYQPEESSQNDAYQPEESDQKVTRLSLIFGGKKKDKNQGKKVEE